MWPWWNWRLVNTGIAMTGMPAARAIRYVVGASFRDVEGELPDHLPVGADDGLGADELKLAARHVDLAAREGPGVRVGRERSTE